jgi:heptosyltransferase II
MADMGRKIVVRAPNWLGDAVMSTVFLRRLLERHPGDIIHVICRPSVKDVFLRFPGVDDVAGLYPGQALGVVRRLRAERYDVGYVLPTSFSAALLFRLGGVRERVGYAADFRGPLLTRALPLDERFHYVRRYLGLIGEAGSEVSAEDIYFPAPAGPAESSAYLLEAAGVPAGARLLAVAPGSQAPARRWFPERFAELINGLPEREWPAVVLTGSASDAAVCSQVRGLCRRPVIDLCGKTGLVAAGDLLRRCAALVTNESGMMHVAWAVGTPSVVLAGPSEPRLTSPFGAAVRVLQRREVPCVPCVRNECFRPADVYKECMTRIGVAEVREALEGLLRSVVPAKAGT